MRGSKPVRQSWLVCFGMTAVALLLFQPATAQNSERLLTATLQEQGRVDTASQRSQDAVEQLADETNDLFADFRVATQQLDRLRIYNDNLERLVADQDTEKASISRQLTEFGDVEKGIVPLMYQLIDDLDSFVKLDMPFQQNERLDRVQRLRRNMERADLTVSEKYRQIMEAYQIETAYGRTIEAYSGSLPIGDEERTVEMLRVGRIVLAFQTPDRRITGIWDKTQNKWIEVDDEFRRSVTDGIRVARKQAAPVLLHLPVPAAEDAR